MPLPHPGRASTTCHVSLNLAQFGTRVALTVTCADRDSDIVRNPSPRPHCEELFVNDSCCCRLWTLHLPQRQPARYAVQLAHQEPSVCLTHQEPHLRVGHPHLLAHEEPHLSIRHTLKLGHQEPHLRVGHPHLLAHEEPHLSIRHTLKLGHQKPRLRVTQREWVGVSPRWP
jgi:hypothetical protein